MSPTAVVIFNWFHCSVTSSGNCEGMQFLAPPAGDACALRKKKCTFRKKKFLLRFDRDIAKNTLVIPPRTQLKIKSERKRELSRMSLRATQDTSGTNAATKPRPYYSPRANR